MLDLEEPPISANVSKIFTEKSQAIGKRKKLINHNKIQGNKWGTKNSLFFMLYPSRNIG